MSQLAPTFPSPEEGQALHRRLLERDPLAPLDLCRACLDPLISSLRTHRPVADEQTHVDAAHEALIDLIHHPENYDPARLDLAGYLRMAARRDLLNLERRERRHQRRRVGISVEDVAEAGNMVMDDDPAILAERAELREATREQMDRITADWDETDRRVLRLLCEGERSHNAFARALEVTQQPLEEQRRLVKQAKDRVKKRLERERQRRE